MSLVQALEEGQPARRVHLQNSALDILRAALCALSWVSTRECAPVHLVRLRASCARLGLDESLMELLDVLEMMREAQNLGRGYWVPTPTRAVRLLGCRLIVSANSTCELERLLGLPIEVGGAGRTVSLDKSLTLPEETVDSWVGAPIDLRHWALDIMEHARANLRSTVHPNERVEVFVWLDVHRRRMPLLGHRQQPDPEGIHERRDADCRTERTSCGCCQSGAGAAGWPNTALAWHTWPRNGGRIPRIWCKPRSVRTRASPSRHRTRRSLLLRDSLLWAR